MIRPTNNFFGKLNLQKKLPAYVTSSCHQHFKTSRQKNLCLFIDNFYNDFYRVFRLIAFKDDMKRD